MTLRAGAPVRLPDGRAGRLVAAELAYDRGVSRRRFWAVVELDRGGRVQVPFDGLEYDGEPPGTPYRDDDDDEVRYRRGVFFFEDLLP